MKKSKIAKIILVLSLLAFVALLGYYFYQKKQNEPEVISKREQYQNEYLQKQEEQGE